MTELVQRHFPSAILGNSRNLIIRLPRENVFPQQQLILLDAEYYLRMPSLWDQIDRLESEGTIPPMRVVLVSHLDDSTRRRESVCDPLFGEYVTNELIPEIRSDGRMIPTILGGLSLTGLAAAHTVINHAEQIDGVICQSPSLWWSEGKILELAAERTPSNSVWRICVGNEETDAPVDHGPGLLQTESQVAACRRFRDLLLNRGTALSYEEYTGGHQLDAWERDFSVSLIEIVRLIRERKEILDAD